MASCGEKVDHRFSVQQVSDEVWLRATGVNLVADYLAGYRSVVDSFLRDKPALELLGKHLRVWSSEQCRDYLDRGRHESLAFLVLMLTGECNADCGICFTDRKRKRGELTPEERTRILRQARALGARYVYIPGEGEPTIDRGFFQLLEDCRELGLEAVVFTNGLVLSDEAACRRYWNLDPDAAVRRLADYPVSFYFKLWSTSPALVGDMMGIDAERYHFTQHDGLTVPAGLLRLLRGFPRERVGLEVVVERRNADEILRSILPFADDHGLARVVELLQHNGRVFGDASFDPSAEQVEAMMPHLSATSCVMATCKAVVTSRGYLSPRIAVLEHQIPGVAADVRGGDLFELLHTTRYLVERRYDLGCLCEEMPVELASGKKALQLGPTSIVPLNLAKSASRAFVPNATIAELLAGGRRPGETVRLRVHFLRAEDRGLVFADADGHELAATPRADVLPVEMPAGPIGVEGEWDPAGRQLRDVRLVAQPRGAGKRREGHFTPNTTVAKLLSEPGARRVRVAGRARRALPAGLEIADGGESIRVALASPTGALPGEADWIGVEADWAPDARCLRDARLAFHRPSLLDAANVSPADAPEAEFIVDPARLEAIRARARLLRYVREFFEERGYLEVQTPILHAAPEACHVSQAALHFPDGRRLYVRTDPEEYLKRYLTAGVEAVFEVSTNVRLDPLDDDHLQEFSSVECYRRFATLDEALQTCSDLVVGALRALRGSTATRLHGRAIDLAAPFATRSFGDLAREHAGFDPALFPSVAALSAELRRRDLWGGTGGPLDGFRRTWLEWLLEHRILPSLEHPTFVVDFPSDLGLSARERGPGIAARGELYLPAGFELAHIYENITTAAELRARYEERLRHRVAAGMPGVPLDEGLMRSASLGMPPMAGMAVGIDRLLMLVLGEGPIGRGLLFPRESVAAKVEARS